MAFGKVSVHCFRAQKRSNPVSDRELEILHQVVNGMNKLNRKLFPNVVLAIWDHGSWHCLAGEKLQKDIFRWLSPPDPWKNYNVARTSRHSGTGAWFIYGTTLSEWKTSGPSSLLWIHGKRKFTQHVLPCPRG
jgi:hypothetical protein